MTLEALFEYWQTALALNDWDIAFSVEKRLRSDDQECYGLCHYDIGETRALVQIADPEFISTASLGVREYFPADQEETLVHELLHVKYATFAETLQEGQSKGFENLIDATAKILVRLKRSTQQDATSFEEPQVDTETTTG